MAWYKREDRDDDLSEEKRSVPAGRVHQVPRVPRGAAHRRASRRTTTSARSAQHHFPMPRRGGWSSCSTRGASWRRTRRSRASTRSASATRSGTATGCGPPGAPPAARTRCLGGSGRIEGHPVELGIFVFEFMGGSMGSVVGEKVTRVFERALERKRPALVFSASGGARMQEGVLSLMQMAKTSAALGRLREAGLPYISVLLHPTTGRRGGQLRHARRRHPGRAEGADRLRRRARHPEHHPPAAAARLPARRVPDGARLPGRDRPAQARCARRWAGCCRFLGPRAASTSAA